MKKKIKIYTHTDGDGHGCSVVLKILLGEYFDIEVEYLNYSDLDKLKKGYFVKNIDEYEHIFVTDLNFSDSKMFELLFGISSEEKPLIKNNFWFNKYNKVHYIDHHKSYFDLHEASKNEINFYHNTFHSATKLLFNSILELGEKNIFPKNNFTKDKLDKLTKYVDAVDAYDTWFWKNNNCTKELSNLAEDLNILFKYFTPDVFEEEIIKNLKASTILTSGNKIILDTLKKLKEDYITSKFKEIMIYQSTSNTDCFAYFEAEQYGNEISDMLLNLEKYPEYYKNMVGIIRTKAVPFIPLVIFKQGSSLSFRSKTNIANKTALLFEGGGHDKASGAPLPKFFNINHIPRFITSIIKGEKFIKNGNIYREIKEDLVWQEK